MFFELRGEYRPKPSYDVCIVGSGAAGITLAAKARAEGLSVFLAEGGGLDYEDYSQALYRGEVVGDEYFPLDEARLRYFGGTTNHWGGMCRPLEEHDFRPKSASPMGGWPIAKTDLDPFLPEVRDVLEIPEHPPDIPLDGDGTLRRVHFVFSPPVRFAEKYGPAFEADGGIDVCFNANIVEVDFDGRAVRRARFRNYGEDSIWVSARAFVLACGGIENSRFLLHWNRGLNGALGDAGGMVGRYWMEHPTATIGDFLVCGDFAFPDDNVYLPFSRDRMYLAPTPAFLDAHGILNCRLRFDRVHHGAVDRMLSAATCPADGWLASILGDADSWNLPVGWVRASSEQVPDPDNRVTLGDDADALGVPRPVVHWRRSALDKKTVRTVALQAAAYLAQADLGRMKLHDWLIDPGDDFACEGGGHCPGGYHHMGGTRMAASPATGVVDRDCRVFGTENLYMAGSSVFPSTGYCNPTMSIAQLALRLGSHLGAALG